MKLQLVIIELIEFFEQSSDEVKQEIIVHLESCDYSQFQKPEQVKQLFQAIIKYLYELQEKSA